MNDVLLKVLSKMLVEKMSEVHRLMHEAGEHLDPEKAERVEEWGRLLAKVKGDKDAGS